MCCSCYTYLKMQTANNLDESNRIPATLTSPFSLWKIMMSFTQPSKWACWHVQVLNFCSQLLFRCQVYCDMTAGGGWMRVVNIDPSRTRSCQSFYHTIIDSLHLCTRGPTYLCYAAEYTVHGKQYSEVRGYAFGYQVRQTLDMLRLKMNTYYFQS